MQENNQNEIKPTPNLNIIETHKSTIITKKIAFDKETYRNLVTITAREFFESKMKDDEKVALMLNKIVNSYYNSYWKTNINN